ncbi:hypothetical protein IM53_013620 [Xanthomonas phaseoli pv. dieffenbachiae]|uniref:Uncharacterized protein n=1 Tax=Xanthomonas phaseoli pv. dieffenbachiae TaxID=92828 RepID=A0A1V9H3U8_9XANT|nr:hypothetical protein IM53_013620 [Xanthomonas phaseoli pv. dieffenbachiae]
MLDATLAQLVPPLWFALELAGDEQKSTHNLCLIPAVCTGRDDQSAQANLAMRICTSLFFALL